MIAGLSALILLRTVCLIQSADTPQQVSLTVAELGGNAILQFHVSDKNEEFFQLYKQPLGYLAQLVAAAYFGKLTVSEQFHDSRFAIREKDSRYFLTIRNVSREDEATYLCQSGTVYSQSFVYGIFLAVNDHSQQKSVNVRQSPQAASVQPGGSMTLRCSLLSKNKDDRVHCPGEHRVYWFRSGPGKSHPAIIYTHRNRSCEQKERSCVYSLSTTIRDSSDAGIYYCAVVTCGRILFGEGTKVDTRSEVDPVVLVLGVLLACCFTVIVVLILRLNRRKVCEHCKGAMSASHHFGHDKSAADQSDHLDDDAKSENYAALDFTTRKVKRETKKSESPQECVYAAVRVAYHNQQLPSLRTQHGL
ncbi:uncharacterized protein LOC121611870 isoform X2 [Chelmon rostratus]|uniref:uncharacterized protein LOC121611870 isoform X2 n=1 Tax=Chelmon rostratus TaxID=109905 RepID=UPI001BEA4FC7|nr:uncharacterized protein LOC121611870 isoform X2 [Chelmon rostratus]